MNHVISDTHVESVQDNDHLISDTQPTSVPKHRKNPQLWQAYLWWNELVEMRKRHNLRISAANRGVSQLDPNFEIDMKDLFGLPIHTSIREILRPNQTVLDMLVEPVNKAQRNVSVLQTMIDHGEEVGPIWFWLLSHKGIGESLAAQLLAQIDDIGNFETVSKLWRFAGFAVFDGKAESKGTRGDKRHFNGRLKGICFNIADMFIKQQTPGYVDIYYAEKAKQRELHPIPFCLDCNAPAEVYQKKANGELVQATRCPKRKKEHVIKWSNSHVHTMAWRKMIKEFLKDLWVEWNRTNSGM